MEIFDKIKYEAYRRYCAFNNFFGGTNDYSIDISNCKLRLDKSEFKIIPICTTHESENFKCVHVFGYEHPTGYIYPRIKHLITTLNLPTKYEAYNDSSDEAMNCFKFGYKLSAIICCQMNGKTFASICQKGGIWIWVIILHANNNLGKTLLSRINKNRINNEDADEWYQCIKM
jgi:hypothetical protein